MHSDEDDGDRARADALAHENPAGFVAFDLLADGEEGFRELPFSERRQRLEEVLAGARPPLLLTPSTGDVTVANEWLTGFAVFGIEGVIARRIE